jgi:putative peptidoglycan lipid II flippase
MQIPAAAYLRHGEDIAGHRAEDRAPETGEALRLAGWMAAGYAAHHLILFVDRALATATGAGSAAILSYGYHLALAVGQLSGLAVSTVIFPRLSEKIAEGDLEGVRQSLNQGLGLVWALALPASLGLIVLRTPIVQVLLQRGAFPVSATAAVADVLAIYAVAVLADAVCQPLWRVIYAARPGPTVLMINSIQTLARLTFNLLLIRVIGYNGLAVSAGLGLWIQVIVLTHLARDVVKWRLPRRAKSFILQVLAAG